MTSLRSVRPVAPPGRGPDETWLNYAQRLLDTTNAELAMDATAWEAAHGIAHPGPGYTAALVAQRGCFEADIGNYHAHRIRDLTMAMQLEEACDAFVAAIPVLIRGGRPFPVGTIAVVLSDILQTPLVVTSAVACGPLLLGNYGPAGAAGLPFFWFIDDMRGMLLGDGEDPPTYIRMLPIVGSSDETVN